MNWMSEWLRQTISICQQPIKNKNYDNVKYNLNLSIDQIGK